MARVGDGAGIGGVDAVDVAVDLAALGLEGGGEGDGGGVGAAAAQRGDLAAVAHPLVARDDDDLAAGELVLDAVRAHLDDPRVEMAIAREDARLRAGEGDRLEAAGLDGDREERHRDALARGEEHVELAPRRIRGARVVRGDLTREGEEAVRGLAHGADDDDDVAAVALLGDDAIGDAAELLDVGHRRAAVLLDDDRSRTRSGHHPGSWSAIIS